MNHSGVEAILPINQYPNL